MDKSKRILVPFCEYLYSKFKSFKQILVIEDNHSFLKHIEDVLYFDQKIELFQSIFDVFLFTSTNLNGFYSFFEDHLRNIPKSQNLLIIFSVSKEELKEIYLSALKIRALYLVFDPFDFLEKSFYLNFAKINKKWDICFFLKYQTEIKLYHMRFFNNLEIRHISHEKLNDLYHSLKEIRQSRLNSHNIQKPVFIVDMKLNEFVYYIREYWEIITNHYGSNFDIINYKPKKNEIQILKKKLQQRIIETFGSVVIDDLGTKRNIISKKTKIKMAQNYLITFSHLGLFDDFTLISKLFTLISHEKKEFYNYLAYLLYLKGNWKIYIDAITETNNIKIDNLKYKEAIIDYIYWKFFEYYPSVRKERWRKQFQFILFWLKSEELHFIIEDPETGKFRIMDNFIQEIITKYRRRKILLHKYSQKEKKYKQIDFIN